MATVCPNCSHPIRPGARYCGFCGTDLRPKPAKTGLDAFPEMLEGSEAASAGAGIKPRPGRAQVRRTILLVLTLLLFLTLLAALVFNFWPQFSASIGQWLGSFGLR